MNINSQERNALFTSKLIEGKDENTANQEIFRDLKFMKEFSQVKKDKEREIRELDKEIDKQTKKLERLKIKGQELVQSNIKSISEPKNYISVNAGSHNRLATTIILKRVIHYLEEHPSAVSSESISNFCCINHSQALDAQNFINKYVRL